MTCETWPVVWPCALPPTASEEQQAAAVSAAQTALWARTGRRLGICDVTEDYSAAGGGWCGLPIPDYGHPLDRGWSGHDCAIYLVQQPVQLVNQVLVYGVVQDPSTYRLEGSRLVRVGGCWPAIHHHGAPPVRVTYSWGVPIGQALWGLVGMAMGEVAIEFLNGMCGGVCKLPGRAVSVTRQGVTVELGPPDGLDPNKLGLPIADNLIDTVNPGARQHRSRVYSPDMPRMSPAPNVTLPPTSQQAGLSTIVLPDAYEGDPYAFAITFPDDSYLAGSPVVSAMVKRDVNQVGADATFTPTVAGRVLTLSLVPVVLTAGTYWLDVSVNGVTYLRKTRLEVLDQVSN